MVTIEDVAWKSVEILSVDGMTLRTGAFRASDKEVVEFTPDVIKKIYDKIKSPIPIYLTHKGADAGVYNRPTLGFAFKFGVGKVGTELAYQSYLFDVNSKSLIAGDGFDSTSAEVDIIRDDKGNVVDGTLTGIALVTDPAIPGTEIDAKTIKLSQPKEGDKVTVKAFGSSKASIEKMLLEKGLSADEVGALWETMNEHFSRTGESKKLQGEIEALNANVKTLTTERDEFKTKFESAAKEIDAVLGEKLTAALNEVKALGFSAPETIVAGMPIKQQLETLGKIKENFAKESPIGGKSPSVPPATDSKTELQNVINEFGLQDQFDKFLKVR